MVFHCGTALTTRESRQLFTNFPASTAKKMSEEILVQRFFSAKRVQVRCVA